ncbi:MAG: hypothetical protein ACI4V7_04370 [Succinivibrionaceae bacterium]
MNNKFKVKGVVFALTLATFLCACEKNADELYMSAKQLIIENKGFYTEKAIEQLEEANNLGSAQASVELAKFYFKKQDYVKAISYISKKPDADKNLYYYILGIVNLKNLINGADKNKGVEFLEKALLGGYSEASLELGDYYEKSYNFEKAILTYQKAINDNNEAKFRLAKLYINNDKISADFVLAFNLIKELSKIKYNVESDLLLAYCYMEGIGVNRNTSLAMGLLEPYVQKDEPYASYLYAVQKIKSNDPKSVNSGFDLMFSLIKRKDIVPEAAYFLYEVYALGLYGYPQDNKKAIYYVRIANKLGYKKAYTSLANCYYHGVAVERNYSEAYSLAKKAYEFNKKDLEANYLLASMFLNGNGVEQNYLKAFEKYKFLAEYNYKDSKLLLATMMRSGYAPQTSNNEAIKIFKELALKDDPRACFYYGQYLYMGMGIKRNLPESLKFLIKAYQKGIKEAGFSIAMVYDDLGDTDNAIYWYNVVAKNSSEERAEAYARIGEIYTSKNELKLSSEYYLKASDLGHENATVNLARIYYILGNFEKAREYFEKVQNNSVAQTFMGLMLEKGLAFRKSEIKALEWYNKAVNQSNTDAMFLKGILLINGKDILDKDRVDATELITRSACRKNEGAINYLYDYNVRIGNSVYGLGWLKYGLVEGGIQKFAYVIAKSKESVSSIDSHLDSIINQCKIAIK